MTQRRVPRLVGAVLVVALVVGGAAPVSAHADLRVSCPGAGETLSALDEITLGFDGPMLVLPEAPPSITLAGSDDTMREIEPSLASPTVFSTPVEGLAEGRYLLAYELYSFDGDLNIGTFEFEIAAGGSEVCALFEVPADDDGGGNATGIVVAVIAGVAGMALLGGFVMWRSRRAEQAR